MAGAIDSTSKNAKIVPVSSKYDMTDTERKKYRVQNYVRLYFAEYLKRKNESDIKLIWNMTLNTTTDYDPKGLIAMTKRQQDIDSTESLLNLDNVMDFFYSHYNDTIIKNRSKIDVLEKFKNEVMLVYMLNYPYDEKERKFIVNTYVEKTIDVFLHEDD